MGLHVRPGGFGFIISCQVICKSLGMASDPKTTLNKKHHPENSESLIPRNIVDSCLPVSMATLFEGEVELVVPAVFGLLWSHLKNMVSLEFIKATIC